jgi:hypothetical protein
VDRGGLTRIVAQHAEHAQPRAARAADRRAHIAGVERAQLVEMTLDQIGELQKDLLALIRLELAPRPFERLARRGDRPVDVFGVALRHGGKQFAGRRIAAFKVLAGSGIHPFAVDEHLFVGAVRMRMAAHWNGLSLGHAVFSSIAVATRFSRPRRLTSVKSSLYL